MFRDHRVRDNWAMLYAQSVALERKQPLRVLVTPLAFANVTTTRQLNFLMQGLIGIQKDLEKLNIAMDILPAADAKSIVKYLREQKAGGLVCDFSPLLEAREVVGEIAEISGTPVHQVDAYNIVPCWEASDKQEFAAYTIRPKINRQLGEFLTNIPQVKKHPFGKTGKPAPIDDVFKRIHNADISEVSPVTWLASGERAAHKQLTQFLGRRLGIYGNHRNDPTVAAQSDLSPYLHFGFIAAQRVALAAQVRDEDVKSQEAFLEEVIVRRELSDNFCNYNDHYDSFDGFPDWARKSLSDHASDPREYIYSPVQFENADTHDELWNAAQEEMVVTGKMHGYMRMYWAKKILEWSPTAAEAMQTAVYLNDKYSIDGNDPNGYTGVAWSIGGVHDRAWFERDIFGKVRYMSYSGCKRKFDIAVYIENSKTTDRRPVSAR
jgi:deoxyribodipyrimidine photo-lyase